MAEPSIKDLAYRTAAGVFGGPVDLATMVMRPFGYKTPDEQVFGSSEYIGKKLEDVGLVSSARAPITEFLTSMAVPTPGGIAKGAALAAPMIGGMFVGKGAKTWDALQASKAKMLADMGTDARTIWQQTGTWKGPDGKWRQEISDKPAFYDPEALTELKSMDSFNYLKDTQPLGGVVEHKELYKAYPDIGDIPVHFMPTKNLKGAAGSYSRQNDKLTLADIPSDQKQIALHEMQHAIQQREGFAGGGNPSQMQSYIDEYANTKRSFDEALKQSMTETDPIAKANAEQARQYYGLKLGQMSSIKDATTNDLYRRLGGEAEARAVEARMSMTPEQRRAMFPEESYDVPINELIIRGVSD